MKLRVAVILVWRPKNFPQWQGRSSVAVERVPPALAYNGAAAPYTAVHIASLLPRSWEISIVHECLRDADLDMDVDAVFLSTMDFCAPRARRLARSFRGRGIKVIVGGLYPSLNPSYFQGAADAVVVGEAEPIMTRLIADLEHGTLAKIYRAERPADLSDLPVPRYDLVETDFSVPLGYEVTRGCPFTCSFCVLSAIRAPYRHRPIGHVIRDLKAVPSNWSWKQRKVITFWDNNLGADRRYFRELCQAMKPLKRYWATQTSMDTITEESARLMGQAGCRYIYVGLESLAEESLLAANKRHNKVREYRQRIRHLHDNGIVVMSIFLLGLDGDTAEYLKALPDLVDEIGVDIPVYSLPVPIEGTPFRAELKAAGRLLPGDLLDGSDSAQLVFRPRHVSPDDLEFSLAYCMQRSYSPWRVVRRIARRVPDGWLPAFNSACINRVYSSYERAVARTGLRRIRERGPWPGVMTEGDEGMGRDR
jgi:radical SAM superfamily enzyme YgiQ (UPF0313 family)